MSEGPTLQQIGAFWRWFARHHDALGEKFENQELLRELDAQVTALGPLVWEVGPGKSADFALTLSPGGDPALLELTMAVVAAAPPLPRWELNWAKPPKDLLAPVYKVQDEKGRPRSIDARRWRYVLLEYPEGLRQLVIEAPDLRTCSEGFQIVAAEAVLDGFLGEERRMRIIHEIEVVPTLTEDEALQSRHITDVARHLPALPDRKH